VAPLWRRTVRGTVHPMFLNVSAALNRRRRLRSLLPVPPRPAFA
jgi:hypothetical protein